MGPAELRLGAEDAQPVPGRRPQPRSRNPSPRPARREAAPAPLALALCAMAPPPAPHGQQTRGAVKLYVANSQGDDLHVIDLNTLKRRGRGRPPARDQACI